MSGNKRIQKSYPQCTAWDKLQEKTDRKIDERVYDLYGLTEEEIGIVEK